MKRRARSEVAYHEAFWVVIGTAAPVFALANVVSVGRVVATFSHPKPWREVWTRAHFKRVRKALLGDATTRAYFLATVSFMMDFWLMGQSLLSLRDEKNSCSPNIAIFLVLLIMAFTLFQVLVRYQVASGRAPED
jgi:hypothetical protein